MRGRRVLAGRYELLEAVGSGGTGAVYRARDNWTRHVVAIKVLHASLVGSHDFGERLRREAEIAQSLTSQQIARVLDFGSDDDGTPFIVMEFIDGTTLQQVLEEHGPIAPREALSILIQIAEALEAAHGQGVVHRDIKPSNIKVTADGSVKVLDFGIAKTEQISTVTFAGAFLGTVHYLAPEQALGRSDVRSDIYSFGVVAFQMLTGQVPFQAEGAWAVVKMHLENAPAEVTQLVPNVPAMLGAIVGRCLSKEPCDRFQTPAELLNALRSLPADEMPGGVPLDLAPRPTRRTLGVLPRPFERWLLLGLIVGGLAAIAFFMISMRSCGPSSEVAGVLTHKTATDVPTLTLRTPIDTPTPRLTTMPSSPTSVAHASSPPIGQPRPGTPSQNHTPMPSTDTPCPDANSDAICDAAEGTVTIDVVDQAERHCGGNSICRTAQLCLEGGSCTAQYPIPTEGPVETGLISRGLYTVCVYPARNTVNACATYDLGPGESIHATIHVDALPQ